MEGDKPGKKKFKNYPIGYFHIDIAEVQIAEGKLYLFVAIDRTSKFNFVQLQKRATKLIESAFQRKLIKTVPYAIHTILTDNGTQSTNANRTKATVKRCHCDRHRQFETHLDDFINAHSCGRRPGIVRTALKIGMASIV